MKIKQKCPVCDKIITDIIKYPGKKRGVNFEKHLKTHKLYKK